MAYVGGNGEVLRSYNTSRRGVSIQQRGYLAELMRVGHMEVRKEGTYLI